jgi:hypothetical protein
MAIKTLARADNAGVLASETDWSEAYVTVYGAGTVFVGPNKEQLEAKEGGTQQGMPLTATNTSGNNGPERIHFIGTLYAIPTVPGTQVDVTVFARRASVQGAPRHRQ